VSNYATRAWLREVGSRDLGDMHHALRMIVKHPMVGGEEARLFTNLADACWNEHVRRCTEKSEAA
jgi:hypothetical protein